MAASSTPTSLLRPLVEDLHARREQNRLGGGEERIARQHAQEKLTARERLALLIDEGTFVEMGLHARPHFSQRAMEGRDAPADGVITGYGKIDGRLVAVCAYDFTVMAGSMGMTGRAEGDAAAGAGADQADPVHLAARLGRSAHPGGGRLAVRRLRAPVPRGGRDERGDPAGRRADGAVRRRHRLHPRPRRLRADGQGPRLDGARRAASRARRGRRGRHPGGARRLARALPEVRCRRHGGRLGRGVHRADQAVPVVHAAELRGAAARARGVRPGRARRRGAARRAAGVQPQALRHVRGDPPDRRRRRVLRHEGPVGEDDHHLLRPLRRTARRDRREPAEASRRDPRQRLRRQGRALRQPLQRVLDPARVPDGRAGVHGRHQGRGRRASSGTARRCSTRSPTRPFRRSR